MLNPIEKLIEVAILHMRAVQVENGCFGDRKYGASNILYFLKSIIPDEYFGNYLYDNSEKTSNFSFRHHLADFPRKFKPNVTPLFIKIKLPVDCVST